jgi:hypothetical protein
MSKEEMREGFEAWHCEQYKTHGTTGAPTRDMHNGVYDEKYGPRKQQVLWECWQSTGGDAAKVEALKEEYEQKEVGDKPVGYLDLIPRGDFGFRSIKCAPHAYYKIPVFTRSDASEIDRLREELAQAKEIIGLKHRDLIEAQTAVTGWAEKCKAAEKRNAELVASIIALPDEFKGLSGCENTAGVYACIDYISDWVAELARPVESGASE